MGVPSYWLQPPNGWDPNYPGDWTELFAMDQPGSGGSYMYDDAVETIVGHIPWAKRYAMRYKVLESAWADTAAPWALHRTVPQPHPDEGALLRAVSVDFSAYNPMGVAVPPVNQGDPVTYTAMTDSVAKSQGPYIDSNGKAQPGNPNWDGAFLKRPNYTRARANIRYKPSPFPYYTDQQMYDLASTYGYAAGKLPEYFRSTSVFDEITPVLQVLAAGSTQIFQWADQPADAVNGPTQGTANGIDPSQVPLLISQASLNVVFHCVPHEFLFGVGANGTIASSLPDKLMMGMGKINSNGVAAGATDKPWFGTFPRGSLRLDAPHLKKKVLSHIRVTSAAPSYLYDVILPFRYVNPTMGPLAGGAKPTFGGWNAFYYALQGLAYTIWRVKDKTKGQFEYFNFDNLFMHHDAPLIP